MIAVSSPLSQVYNIPKMYKMHKRGLFISSLPLANVFLLF